MTEPRRVLNLGAAPITPVDWPSVPTWCSRCEVHQATNLKPLCPCCLDQERRDER